jgi:hypothetical protein
MYEKFLARWLAGKITETQIDLLVKCGWLTADDGDKIKSTENIRAIGAQNNKERVIC